MSRGPRQKVQTTTEKLDSEQLRRRIDRLIRDENYKDALKQAKFLYRSDATDDNHRLLERASFLWVQQLADRGMNAEAKSGAVALLEMGVTEDEIIGRLLLLLPRIGLADRVSAFSDRLKNPDVSHRLFLASVDRAVMYPDEAGTLEADVRQETSQIRASLEALQGGNDSQALESLQSIPRSSPLADWRLFIRGLAAFQQGQYEQADANWDRLDPARAPKRIADSYRKLLKFTGTNSDSFPEIAVFERAVFGESVLPLLQRFSPALEAWNWKQLRELLPPLVGSLKRIDVRFAQRLTEVFLPRLGIEARSRTYKMGRQLIDDATSILEPLPFDPKWHRFWAVLWEYAEDAPVDHIVAQWAPYLESLDENSAFPDDEANCLYAIVTQHMAKLLISELAANRSLFRFDADRDPATEENYEMAVQCLEKSLECDSSQYATYKLLIDAHRMMLRPDAALEATRRALIAFPNDVPLLEMLYENYKQNDLPHLAKKYVEQLRVLQPLEERWVAEEWGIWLALARDRALAEEWDPARAHLERAQKSPVSRRPASVLVRRAIVEHKAKRKDLAEDFIRQALEVEKPGAVWLELAVEAARYGLPDTLRRQFNRDFKSELSGPPSSELAASLARILNATLDFSDDYKGRKEHVKAFLSYIQNPKNFGFTAAELEQICQCVYDVGSSPKLCEKLSRLGMKRFRDAPMFGILLARLEIDRGPFGANLNFAKRCLKNSLDRAARSDSSSPQLIGFIREQMRLVESLESEMKDQYQALEELIPKGIPKDLAEFFLETAFDMRDSLGDEQDEFEPIESSPRKARSKSTRRRTK